jgi:hypothetical protein
MESLTARKKASRECASSGAGGTDGLLARSDDVAHGMMDFFTTRGWYDDFELKLRRTPKNPEKSSKPSKTS